MSTEKSCAKNNGRSRQKFPKFPTLEPRAQNMEQGRTLGSVSLNAHIHRLYMVKKDFIDFKYWARKWEKTEKNGKIRKKKKIGLF